MTKNWSYTKNEAALVNRLAREQFKVKLLAEIAVDMQICLLEGTDPYEYVDELIEELQQIKQKQEGKARAEHGNRWQAEI